MTRISTLLGHGLAGGDGDRLCRTLPFVREHLGMDLVVVAESLQGREVCRAFDGDADAFGVSLDSAADSALNQRAGGDGGSVLSVPIQLSDGRLYGSLICLSGAAMPLFEHDRTFLTLFAEMLGEQLERPAAAQRQRTWIQQALAPGAMTMAMQPIISLADGRCTGVEALARFPVLDTAPDVVFGLAHEAGLGTELELAAIRAALAQRCRLPAELYLSVNVGPSAIVAPGFESAIRSGGALPGLVLEITEHVSVNEYAGLRGVLAPLRAEGLRLAVDDVGAGYASLRHVLRMRPDIIKIDRSLIDGIAGDVAQRSIVTSIVLLSLDLGADIVAEGVERPADVAALADLGVDMVQGYLFARPSTEPSDCRGWARTWPLPNRGATAPGDARRSGAERSSR